MKKFFLILLVAALMGSFAFAEVTGVAAPSVSGSVTTTFGFDLDDSASGFLNESSVNVTLPLTAGGDSKAGSGDAYAEIAITDAAITVSEDDGLEIAPDLAVSAKLVFGNVWVGLNNPDFSFNAVAQADDDDANMTDLAGDGMSVGFMSDMFSVSLLVASVADGYLGDSDDVAAELAVEGSGLWDTTDDDAVDAEDYTANVDNEYAFGVNATVTAGPLTMPVWFSYLADVAMGFGAAPSVDLGMITLDIPVDYVTDLANDDNGFEVNPAVSVALDGVGTLSANLFYAMYDVVAIAFDEEINVGVGFVEGFDDALTMSVDFTLEDLTEAQGDMSWEVQVASSYDMGSVAPYLNFGYYSDGELDLSVGAVFATMIDMATVTLDYTNDGLLELQESGRVTLAVNVAY